MMNEIMTRQENKKLEHPCLDFKKGKDLEKRNYKKTHRKFDIDNILFTCENILKEKNNLGVPTQEQGFKCTSICEERNLEVTSLAKQMRNNNKVKPNTCTKCKKNFIYLGALISLDKIECDQQPQICTDCEEETTQIIHSDADKDNTKEEKLYQSTKMREQLPNSMNLFIGNKSHTEERFSQQSECRKINLTKTWNLIQNREDNPYKCVECKMSFSTSQQLTRHNIKIHTRKKLYNCSYCSEAFAQKSTLSRHMRIHTTKTPYKCTECGKLFSYNRLLIVHMRVHTREKPYKCEVCGKTFRQSSHLAHHARIHTGEKPYRCGVCGKCFTFNDNLIIHERLHTGEKPYECEICKMRFKQKSNLNGHMRTHTKEKSLYSCTKCGSMFGYRSNLSRHIKAKHTGNQKNVACSSDP